MWIKIIFKLWTLQAQTEYTLHATVYWAETNFLMISELNSGWRWMQCGKESKSKALLKMHIEFEYMGITHTCEMCNHTYKTKDTIQTTAMLALVKSRVDIIWLTHCHLLVELAAINDFKLAVVVCYPCMLVVLALGNIMRCLLTKTYKNVQNHPESVATTLNETCRVKNGIIVGVGNPDNW